MGRTFLSTCGSGMLVETFPGTFPGTFGNLFGNLSVPVVLIVVVVIVIVVVVIVLLLYNQSFGFPWRNHREIMRIS